MACDQQTFGDNVTVTSRLYHKALKDHCPIKDEDSIVCDFQQNIMTVRLKQEEDLGFGRLRVRHVRY